MTVSRGPYTGKFHFLLWELHKYKGLTQGCLTFNLASRQTILEGLTRSDSPTHKNFDAMSFALT